METETVERRRVHYVKVARDCEKNNVKIKFGNTKGLIYDFVVYINGEHRATFKKDFRSGYDLYDTNGEQIASRYYHCGIVAQGDFPGVIEQNFHKIPTLAQQKLDAAYNEARKDNRKFDDDRTNARLKLEREVLLEALRGYRTTDPQKSKVAVYLFERYNV